MDNPRIFEALLQRTSANTENFVRFQSLSPIMVLISLTTLGIRLTHNGVLLIVKKVLKIHFSNFMTVNEAPKYNFND